MMSRWIQSRRFAAFRQGIRASLQRRHSAYYFNAETWRCINTKYNPPEMRKPTNQA
jgi:hypothetical protein